MSAVRGSPARRAMRLGVAGLLTGSGVLHLARPSAFDDFLPGWTPSPRAVNAVAGTVELVCAYGLLARRSWAGPASAMALLAVWPSNLQFALGATAEGGVGSARAVVAWARMPLQIPMIWAVLAPVDTLPRD